MQTVISSWLNLEKTIFKPENELYTTRMITCDVSLSTVSTKRKNSAVEEGDKKYKLQ